MLKNYMCYNAFGEPERLKHEQELLSVTMV